MFVVSQTRKQLQESNVMTQLGVYCIICSSATRNGQNSLPYCYLRYSYRNQTGAATSHPFSSKDSYLSPLHNLDFRSSFHFAFSPSQFLSHPSILKTNFYVHFFFHQNISFGSNSNCVLESILLIDIVSSFSLN